MEYSGQKDGKLRFCRVDADTESLKAQDAETPALDAEALTKLFREATGMESLKVELQALRDEQLPAMLVEDEQTRRFKDMSRLYGEKGFSLPDDFTLVLNSRSALVSALAGAKDPQRAQLIAAELYDLAELSRAPLSPQQMTAFLSRSMRLCELAVGND